MEIVLFATTGIIVYLLTDRLVRMIDNKRDEPYANRQVLFFVVFFALILLSFELLKFFLATPG